MDLIGRSECAEERGKTDYFELAVVFIGTAIVLMVCFIGVGAFVAILAQHGLP